MYEGVVEKSSFRMFVSFLILIIYFLWPDQQFLNQTFYSFLTLVSFQNIQFWFCFLFRKYRFDLKEESINFSLSILYIKYPLSIKVLSNCCLVVSWSDVFCFNSSLLLIISSSDSTNQNSSSFSYFEDNLDSEIKELFPLSYIFLKFFPQSVI